MGLQAVDSKTQEIEQNIGGLAMAIRAVDPYFSLAYIRFLDVGAQVVQNFPLVQPGSVSGPIAGRV